nr:hypothetical protein GZ37B2_107 [uncultured archaeon GZfos37B2]
MDLQRQSFDCLMGGEFVPRRTRKLDSAENGGDRESRRHRDANIHHLSEIRPLRPEEIFHSSAAFGSSVSEKVNVSLCIHVIPILWMCAISDCVVQDSRLTMYSAHASKRSLYLDPGIVSICSFASSM